jgi:hypothetical protein
MSDDFNYAATRFKPNPSILLQPGIVKPLHEVNPRTVMGRKWWDEKRREAYESTGFHCLACGVDRVVLEAHEEYKINFKLHRYTLKSVVPLCYLCHAYIHLGRCEMQVRRGEMTRETFIIIAVHGDHLLGEVGLDKDAYLLTLCDGDINKFYPELNGSWNKWHLFIEGKKFFSPHKTYEEWKERWSRE